MSQVDIILARCKIGQTILDKLMSMKDSEIKDFLRKVVTVDIIQNIVWEGDIIRTINNEIVQSIELCRYDLIEVNAHGIKYTPNNRSGKFVILFDDNFVTTSIRSELGLV